jgi:hypothetical protein
MLAVLPSVIADNPGPSLAVVIVLVGLLGLGHKDLVRFSLTRALAIGSVAFRQSIRHRVLWITPLVILGIIVVSQLQKSLDPQDEVRQTTMICLFATALVLILLMIMLGCTNLPHEIESRVIYTVATKPATRLEIVLGKVIGFAGVSLAILLIMGLFTWSYLHLRDWQLRRTVAEQLALPGAVAEVNRPTLEYYRDKGTLHARDLGRPESLSIYAHLPADRNDRWSPGENEGEMFVPLHLSREQLPPPADTPAAPTIGPAAGPPPGSLMLLAEIKVQKSLVPPAFPTTQETPLSPHVLLNLTNSRLETVVSSSELGQPNGFDLTAKGGLLQVLVFPAMIDRLIPRDALEADVYLNITGVTPGYDYSTSIDRVGLFVPETRQTIRPLDQSTVLFMGRDGQYGQQLRGGKGEHQRVAVYSFKDQKPAGARDAYPFELRLGVERLEDADSTRVLIDVYGRDGAKALNIPAFVETNRPVYFEVPAQAVRSGNFDVVLRTQSDAWLGLRAGPAASLKFVKDDQIFAWNLLKSLAVLWLLSVLVIIISIFASTFLSWPIAVVLTAMILSGRWCAEQVGELSVGRQFVNDILKGATSEQAKAVSESIDALVQTLRAFASFLPDLTRFAVVEDIQRGMVVSTGGVLWPSLMMTLGFGIPLLVLSYVFLKYKEVAP